MIPEPDLSSVDLTDAIVEVKEVTPKSSKEESHHHSHRSHIDPNTGEKMKYCDTHKHYHQAKRKVFETQRLVIEGNAGTFN